MKKILFLFAFFFLCPSLVQAEVGSNDPSVPIIGTQLCQTSRDQGGWGGVCKSGGFSGFVEGFNVFRNPSDACDNNAFLGFGEGTEEYVGVCELVSGGAATRSDCCVPRGTALQNPTSENYLSLITSEGVCEAPYNANGSGYGGKCEDIDSNGWDPTGGWIDGREPTCDTPGEVVAALCSDALGDAFNGCCVPKEGDYCRRLTETNGGSDICATMGSGGNVIPLEYGDYELLEQIPGSSNTSGKLQPYLESIYKAGFVLIVIGAIFMIGFGGFTYMASAGNTSMMKKGKSMITDAIIGLVVALSIWLILNIINPDLVNLQLDPLPGLSFDPGGSGANIAAGGTGDRCTPIPEANLVTIDGYQMLRSTGEKFTAMREAARSAGITLELRSGYRSPQRQLEIWNQYGCSMQSGRASCNGGRAVAVPCSLGGGGSNHSTGEAIDINVGCGNGVTNCNTATYRWLKANGGRYNFYNNLPSDPPHWSATGR